MSDETKPVLFMPGTIVCTVGAMEVATHPQIIKLLQRHLAGDWGDLGDEDKRANEHALKWSERIVSKYEVGEHALYIITERDRSATTVMEVGEY